jgi:hypothetical protein
MTKQVSLEEVMREEDSLIVRKKVQSFLSRGADYHEALDFLRNPDLRGYGGEELKFEGMQVLAGRILLKVAHKSPSNGHYNHCMVYVGEVDSEFRGKYPSGAVVNLKNGEVMPYDNYFKEAAKKAKERIRMSFIAGRGA